MTGNKLSTPNLTACFLKQVMNLLPGRAYIKGVDDKYFAYNSFFFEELLKDGIISSGEDIIGKTDYDLFTKQEANSYRQHDLLVMQQKITLMFQERARIKASSKRAISCKTPLYDENDDIAGTVGYSMFYTTISNEFGSVALSRRRMDCLSLLYGGYQSKEIAKTLRLSRRTVETYLEYVRHELAYDSKSSLINCINENNLGQVMNCWRMMIAEGA